MKTAVNLRPSRFEAVPSTLPEKIDQYKITGELGHGGFGIVYLGYDPLMDKKLAIKTLRNDATAEIKHSFWKEAKNGRLEHDNIVILHRISSEDAETPFIAMEYIDGDPLDQLITGGNGLTLADKLDIVRQVCCGLHFAHSNGVIHRDIKPANVIRRRSDGRVKILDFGIAKVKKLSATADLTKTKMLMGTPGYIAPERWSSRPEDHRVDIFSTGVMLYYLVTGREPFVDHKDEDFLSTMRRIVDEPYPPLSLYVREFPPGLTSVLDRALAKQPIDRYYSAMDFADDLAALMEDLNRARVPTLLREAQKSFDNDDWSRTLEFCQQVNNIERGNPEARALKERAQRKKNEQDTEEKVQAFNAAADEALANKRYDDAIRYLEELNGLRAGNPEFQQKLQDAIDKRQVLYKIEEISREAKIREDQGDLNAALPLRQQASLLDPGNLSVQLEIDRLTAKIKEEEGRKRNERYILGAEHKIASRQFTLALEDLARVRSSGIGHEKLDALYEEALQGQKGKEAGQLKEQFLTQATKYRYAQQYELALTELDRGLDTLRGDTALLRSRQEIQAEFNEFRESKWIAETAEAVRNQGLVSTEDALATLREAMRKMPGVKTFVTLEKTLLGRMDEERNRQIRAECLRQAAEELSANRPEHSIQIIDSYLLKHPPHPDIDGLLREARQSVEQQRLRTRVAQCAANARSLLDEGSFDEAIRLLEPVSVETNDGELAELLERARQGKAEVDRGVVQLARRITELRRAGKLKEAVELIEAQPASTLRNPSLAEILAALRKELERDEALAAAISRSQKALTSGEWETAREPLDDVRRVFGDFDVLKQSLAQFETSRTRAADKLTSQSVATANAAVLAGDKKAAVHALGNASIAIPFASAAVAQDWKKRAEEFNVPAPQRPEDPTPKAGLPLWAIGLAALAVLVVGLFLWKTSRPKPQQILTYVQVTKAPPGATVLIDGLAPVQTDSNGLAKILVKPGHLSVKVTKEGFTSYSDEIDVDKGVLYGLTAKLTDTQTTGTLVVQGNAEKFRLFVDNDLAGGNFRPGDRIQIEKGNHTIRYEADGFDPSPDKKIVIAKGADLGDTFNLTLRANSAFIQAFSADPSSVTSDLTPVTLRWRTSNATKASIDGVGDVPPNGQKTVTLNEAKTYTLTAEGGDAKSVRRQVSISLVKLGAANITSFIVQPTTAKPRDAVTLTWQTKDATEVSIDQGVGRRDSSGSTQVSIPKDAKGQFAFQMVATGKGGNAQQTVSVEVVAPPPAPVVVSAPAPPPATVAAQPTPTPTVRPTTPIAFDPGVLRSALTNFEGVFKNASGKDKKACIAAFATLSSVTSKGVVNNLSGFCDVASSFASTHECSNAQPRATDDDTKATWSCNVTISYRLKDNGTNQSKAIPSTFEFAKNPADASWRVVKWAPQL